MALARMAKKSCYVLQLSVPSGGAHRCSLFIYNRPEHIRACLEQEFLNDDELVRAFAAYLAVWYGETIEIAVVEAGQTVKTIDLHPFIRIRVDGGEPIPLTEAPRFKDEWWPDGEELTKSIAFDVDWTAIAAVLPSLAGDPLRPGETISLDVGDRLRYGFSDLEAETDEVPQGWIDPDPG